MMIEIAIIIRIMKMIILKNVFDIHEDNSDDNDN